MKKCMGCGEYNISNSDHDYCYDCFQELEEGDLESSPEENFQLGLIERTVYTAYIMFYQKNKTKIGYTNDLNSRLIEIKRQFPENKLVYFREFSVESGARRFEAWLKGLSDRDLIKVISDFQDKLKKVEKI